MPSAVSFVDDEQSPDIPCLMVHAGKTLDGCRILRDQKDGMVQIPSNFFVCDKVRV
jgi:hypothetical protein